MEWYTTIPPSKAAAMCQIRSTLLSSLSSSSSGVVVIVIVIKVRLHHHCPSDANIDCYVRHLSCRCHNPPPLPKPPCLSSALVFVLVAASLLLLSLSSLTYARRKYAEVHRTGVFGFWDVFRPQKFRRHVRPPRLNFCLFRK